MYFIEDDRLKPCPFCGGKAKILIRTTSGTIVRSLDEFNVYLNRNSSFDFLIVHSEKDEPQECECPIATVYGATIGTYSYDTIEEAIEAWNKRI